MVEETVPHLITNPKFIEPTNAGYFENSPVSRNIVPCDENPKIENEFVLTTLAKFPKYIPPIKPNNSDVTVMKCQVFVT